MSGHGGGSEGEPIATVVGEAFFVAFIMFLFIASLPDLFADSSGHHH